MTTPTPAETGYPPIKKEWSTVNVESFGPYFEANAAALARKFWSDPTAKQELLRAPKGVLERELGIDLGSKTVKVIDKKPDEFYFVLAATPPKDELWYRYEQISGWWMFAHAFWWWMTREHGDKVALFLNSLNVQIIGRSWNDVPWRQAMIDDPRATLEKELGAEFPPHLKVRSLVDDENTIHFVLPTHPKDEDVEGPAEHLLAGLFAMAHTWWQWLVWPKLQRPIDKTAVTGMVD